MKNFIKIINLSIAAILILIAIGIAYIAIPAFGNHALIVRSGSMSPTIDVGSMVVVRESFYKVGDVIAFRSDPKSETLITHRIIEKVAEGDEILYKTKGDANNSPDEVLVYQENVLGKTTYVLPYVGKIMAFAKSDLGFPILIIIPALFVIFLEAISIFKVVRKRKKKKSDPFGFENHEITKTFSKNIIGLKLLVPFFAFSLLVPSTLAFYSDSEVSNGNVFQAADYFPPVCESGTAHASLVISNSQGTKKNLSPVLPPRDDPNEVLGAPNWSSGGSSGFHSLGLDGSITIRFDYPIDSSGADDLIIYEATNGRNSYPLEQASVEVSTDGVSYTNIGNVTSEPGGDGITSFDLTNDITFVRLTESTDFSLHNDDADGIDIDSFEGELFCQ